jgi:hypothetical protein
LKELATQIEEERNHALDLSPVGPEEPVERGERAEAGEGFAALWSSARRDDDVLQTTQPGDALQLFADPAPSPALAAFTTTAAYDVAHRPAVAANVDQAVMILKMLRPKTDIRRPQQRAKQRISSLTLPRIEPPKPA